MQSLKTELQRLKTTLALATTIGGSLLLPGAPVAAQDSDPGGWYTRAWGGLSTLSDTSGTIDGFQMPGASGEIDVSTDSGFTAGAGVGYRYGPRVGVEVAWEYRTNDSETNLTPGPSFSSGNYASNTFFLNGFYYLNSRGAWEPYVGAGLSWIQEVDIDLEGSGPEQSFSGDGDVGYQLFIGTNYRLSDQWSAHGELRYGSATGIDLEGENVMGTIGDFDYEPVTVQFGLSYRF